METLNDNQGNILHIVVDESDKNTRLDKYIADETEGYSRSFIQKLIKEKSVTVNGKSVKPNYNVNTSDNIDINIPKLIEPQIEAENIPLDILYEDDDIIVINKPKGMVVHPAAGHYSGTLVNALMYHCKDNLSGINGVLRPGIVHRIDMDTTGVLVVCKNDFSHNSIAQQLSVHSITRKYNAIVYNAIKEQDGTVDAPIGRSTVNRKKMAIDNKNGRRAVTHYHVIENLGKYSYIECQLETGRTHQIRVHLSEIGYPVVGDTTYSNGKNDWGIKGQCLHAKSLKFKHPVTGKEMFIEAPLPEYFENVLQELRK